MQPFRPLMLLTNPHVQTILGNLLQGQARPPRGGRRIVALPDGDAIAVHETPPRDSNDHARARIALLVHGLGGCYRSSYMERVTLRLSGLGWRVFRMDLRGAGAGVKLARRLYNAACSADVAAVVANLTEAFPQAALAVAGFSLGGSIVLKYGGEFAHRVPPTLSAIAALAPPIDLIQCAKLIATQKFYNSVYVDHLLRQVKKQQFPDLPRTAFPRRMSLRQFDDLYTAPRSNFVDALDYYRQASARPWIERIGVPTFILTARDDPFIAVEPFESLRAGPHVETHIVPHGGHLGFLGVDGAGGIRWAETQIVHWLEKQVANRRV